jgi:putative transferase (TIGR04331 family)
MEMYLPASLILALMAKTGFKARLAISPVLTRWLDNTSATTHPRRSDLNKVVCGEADPFLAVLAKTLPLHLPLLYLEGYAAAREWAKRAGRGARVRGFISATGYFIHEPVKFLAAELQENGVRLVATQHGGGYGQLRHHPCEALERAGADEYWSWGWTATAEEIRPLVHPKLSSWAMKATAGHPRQADYIYFIANNMPRYHYRTWSCPVGPQMLEYFQWQARFLGALPRALLDSLVFRCFPQDYDWGIRQRLKEAVPGLCLEEPGCNYHQGLLNARLVVCDMNMTTLLESLAANLPTVAFWDENRWEARPSAQPYLQQLQEAGILFHDPEAAAGAVSRYWPAPEDWWNTALVQEARRQFVHRYARTGPHWQGEWRQSLGDLLLRAKKMFLLPLPQLSPRRRSED